MQDRIELSAKSDRELLLLTAQTVNDLCTDVRKQNGRLSKLEKFCWMLMGGLLVLTSSSFLALVLAGLEWLR